MITQSDAATPTTQPELAPSPERYRDDPEAQSPEPEPEPVTRSTSSSRKAHSRRFLKLLLFAISVYLLFIGARWVYYRRFYKPQYRWPDVGRSNFHHCLESGDWSPSSDGWPKQSQASFEVPLSDSRLRFVADGHNLGGQVNIVTSKEQKAHSVTVQVTVLHESNKVPTEVLKVCRITQKLWPTRNKIEEGVAIRTPLYDWKYKPYLRPIKFSMNIVLPDVESYPFAIDSLRSYISNGDHNLADINEKIIFGDVYIHGTNGKIRAESISLKTGWFTTTNGNIEGTFNSTQSLGLLSQNGAIRADIGLLSSNEFALFTARTTNGLISANVSLLTNNSEGGVFDVTTVTSNGALEIDFPSAPLDSTLRYTGKTSNGPASVTLNPAYEGYFNLRSTGIAPKVVNRPDIQDPSGQGRRKILSYKGLNTELSGQILWGVVPKGNIAIETTNAPLVLKV